MRRDISIIVFKNKHINYGYVCRACYNTQDRNQVIKNCSGIFVRTCDQNAKILFNNKEHETVLSTEGFCNIKSYSDNRRCLTNENCINCQTKNDAIRIYKQNNFLL